MGDVPQREDNDVLQEDGIAEITLGNRAFKLLLGTRRWLIDNKKFVLAIIAAAGVGFGIFRLGKFLSAE